MIARLHGQVVSSKQDSLVLDVGGVGFRVRVPRSLLQELEGPGQSLTLHTHLHVRESELALFGCTSEEQLELFEVLLGVSGIGPRVAMNIVSAVAPDVLRDLIARGDTAALTRVPGIGKRTADRLIIELKGKVTGPEVSPLTINTGDAEVIAALTALGYSVAEAQQALRGLPPADALPLEERLRLALRSLARE